MPEMPPTPADSPVPARETRSIGRVSRRPLLLFAAVILAGTVLWVNSRWKDTRTLLDQGLAAVELADSAEVERVRARLTRAGSHDEEVVVHGAWLVRRRKYAEALRVLPPEMLDGPQRHHIMRLVGTSLFHLGDFAKAEVLLARLTAESNREVDAHRTLAAMYYDLGADELVLRELNAVERLAPDDYRPHHLAGMIHLDAEEFETAVRDFRQALDKHPPAAIAALLQLELAKSLIRNRQYQSAVDELASTADSHERTVLLAECYWSLGDAGKASELTESVLKTRPDDPDALRLHAKLLEQSGQLDQAIQALHRLLKQQAYDVESRYLLVQLLGSRGLTEQRDLQQAEYLRWRKLHDRLVELNLKASEEPDAVQPRRELVTVCRELGRDRLADMWQRSADYCEQRLRAKGEDSSS